MTRITLINRPEDYPGTPDQVTAEGLEALFGHLFPHDPEGRIDESHAGLAIAAHNPTLALSLTRMSVLIAGELSWAQRPALRELAIQAVNIHFDSRYSFRTRLPYGQAAGLSPEQQEAIGDWQQRDCFSDEQRLVIEYAQAVASGKVPDQLFNKVLAEYGEKDTVELTTVISFWSFWAMMLNATHPE